MDKIQTVDCHRHLGGCVPISFVWDVVQKFGLKHLGENKQDIIKQMTFHHDEPRAYHRFLNKFRILDEIPWTEELIDDCIAAICNDLDLDGVDYTWMSFSINKYMHIGWHKHEAISFIYDSFNKYRPGKVGLMLALKYESTHASQRQYAQLIESSANKLIGIDMVGDETQIDFDFHCSLLQHWRSAGKIVRAHAGEFGPAENIRYAILRMGVTNIAHGIKIISDTDLIKIAIDNNICFDLGLSSNLLTGVSDENNHPILMMLDSGLDITIGTDDPVVCNTNINAEYDLCSRIGVSQHQLSQIRKTAFDKIGRAHV